MFCILQFFLSTQIICPAPLSVTSLFAQAKLKSITPAALLAIKIKKIIIKVFCKFLVIFIVSYIENRIESILLSGSHHMRTLNKKDYINISKGEKYELFRKFMQSFNLKMHN